MLKVEIIEKTHELDLQDEVNKFLHDKTEEDIIRIEYQTAMTYSTELEYSFSCMIVYKEKET